MILLRHRLPLISAAVLILTLSGCGRPEGFDKSPPADAPKASEPEAAAGSEASDLGEGQVSVVARTATITLPLRLSEGLAWVSATTAEEAAPFVFKGLDIRPGAGPKGADLAVFTYEAVGPGAATLTFGLVPAGKMLIGPKALVYSGPVARTFSAKVEAR